MSGSSSTFDFAAFAGVSKIRTAAEHASESAYSHSRLVHSISLKSESSYILVVRNDIVNGDKPRRSAQECSSGWNRKLCASVVVQAPHMRREIVHAQSVRCVEYAVLPFTRCQRGSSNLLLELLVEMDINSSLAPVRTRNRPAFMH